MKNYAIEKGYKYFMYYDPKKDLYIIQEVSETGLYFTNYGQFYCSRNNLYYRIQDVIQVLYGTLKPIIYHDKNINKSKRSVLLHYNGSTFNYNYNYKYEV